MFIGGSANINNQNTIVNKNNSNINKSDLASPTPKVKTSKFAAPKIILPTDDGSLIFCENSKITIKRSNINGAQNYELRVWDVTRGDNNPAINRVLSFGWVLYPPLKLRNRYLGSYHCLYYSLKDAGVLASGRHQIKAIQEAMAAPQNGIANKNVINKCLNSIFGI